MYLLTVEAMRLMAPPVSTVSARSCAMRAFTVCNSAWSRLYWEVPGTTFRMAFRSSAWRWLNSAVVIEVTFISDRSCLMRASFSWIVVLFFLIVAVISAMRTLLSPPSARSFFCSARSRSFSIRRSFVSRVSRPISLRAGSPFTMMFRRRSSSLRVFPMMVICFRVLPGYGSRRLQ